MVGMRRGGICSAEGWDLLCRGVGSAICSHLVKNDWGPTTSSHLATSRRELVEAHEPVNFSKPRRGPLVLLQQHCVGSGLVQRNLLAEQLRDLVHFLCARLRTSHLEVAHLLAN